MPEKLQGGNKLKYTIVVPCLNEEGNIEEIYQRVKNVMEPFNFELLFVNDGSTDKTLECIKTIRLKDRRVKFLSFLTNYGHQRALFAGLHFSRHEFVITMDADLQHPPEFIPELIMAQQNTNAHVVAGRRRGSQKGFLKNFFSETFYRIFEWATGYNLKPGLSDFRLYTRKAVDILCSIREQEPFLRGMTSSLKLKVSMLHYDVQDRYSGVSSYSFEKSLRMAITALFRFSDFPVKLGLLFGILGILLSLAQAFHYLYLRFFTNELIPGQADLMVFLGLISSAILVQLSLLVRLNLNIMDAQRCQPGYIIDEKGIDE